MVKTKQQKLEEHKKQDSKKRKIEQDLNQSSLNEIETEEDFQITPSKRKKKEKTLPLKGSNQELKDHVKKENKTEDLISNKKATEINSIKNNFLDLVNEKDEGDFMTTNFKSKGSSSSFSFPFSKSNNSKKLIEFLNPKKEKEEISTLFLQQLEELPQLKENASEWISHIQAELTQLQLQKRQLEIEKLSFHQKLTLLQRENQLLQTDNQFLKDQRNQLEQEIFTLKNEIASLQRKKKLWEVEKKEIKEQRKEILEKEREALKREKKLIEKENELLQKEKEKEKEKESFVQSNSFYFSSSPPSIIPVVQPPHIPCSSFYFQQSTSPASSIQQSKFQTTSNQNNTFSLEGMEFDNTPLDSEKKGKLQNLQKQLVDIYLEIIKIKENE